MSHLYPDGTSRPRCYTFVLFFLCAHFVFANMAMAQKQRIIVGVLENWPPQYMTDPNTREPIGFAVDTIREVARLSELDIQYEVFKEWPVLNQALREKRIDVIPNMGIIEEREKIFDYTIPVETTTIMFFVRETSTDINSEIDLVGRPVSVVETNKGRFLLEQKGGYIVNIYQSFDEALMSLLSGISDGFVYPDPPFMSILDQYGLIDRVKAVGEPLFEVKRAIAVHKGNSELRNKLNDSVKVLMSSAEFKEIYSKWYGQKTPFWNVKRVAVIMGIFVSLTGLALLTWRFYSVMKLNKRLLVQTQKRDLAEKALHTSQEDLIESQRIAHVGSWRLDVSTNQVIWSEELYKMYGFDPAFPPPPYTEHQKLFTPESWHKLSTALNRTKERGIPYELELETTRRDGSHGWMWVRGEALFNTSGEITGLRGAAQDITERKLAENSLVETELRYQALFENMTAGFVLFEVVQDDQGAPVDLVILAANQGFELTTGLKLPEVIGKRFLHVLPDVKNDSADWIGTYGNVALTGVSRQFDQESEHLGIYYSIIAYQAGPKQCAVTFIDITDRKMAVKERERLLTAIEQTDDMVIITAPDGKIQYVNPAFESVTGYTQADVRGQNPRLLSSGKQDQAFYRGLWETLARGNVWKGRMVNKRKDGTLYTEESTITPVKDSKGRLVNYVSVKRDITEYMRISEEKNRLEKQLIQAQKMESVGRLAGGVAHDYNNISSIIIGFSELALEKVDPDGPLHDALMEIFRAAKRSTDITRQLLAFARQQTIAPQILDMNDTIESMLKMFRRLIGEDIDLAWLPGAEIGLVKIDPSQVDQILANLCVNARDAIADVGKVTIETMNINFDETYCATHADCVAGDFVSLIVSDTGSGIAPKTLEHIFEPFFTTKDMGKGTGLGLATVYGIVRQNDGFINVYSELGKGTAIKVYLPRYTGHALEAQAEKQLDIPLSRENEVVLLVEDDASILKLGRKMLEKLGYVVLSANSPHRALSVAQNHDRDINLLITDVVMPEMNGRELSQKLQSMFPNLKIIFMSGYTANVIAHRGVLDDGVNFISKPFSTMDMAIKVRNVLDS